MAGTRASNHLANGMPTAVKITDRAERIQRADSHQPPRTNRSARTQKGRCGRVTGRNRSTPASSVTLISVPSARSLATFGSRFDIRKPSGTVTIRGSSTYATTDQMNGAHDPMKTNHKRETRQPGWRWT